MERKMSLFSFFALANASGHQGNQSTGLCAWSKRYGLVSRARRLVWTGLASFGFGSCPVAAISPRAPRQPKTTRKRQRESMMTTSKADSGSSLTHCNWGARNRHHEIREPRKKPQKKAFAACY